MTCTIRWLDLSLALKKEHFQTIKCPNLLQSPAYGEAMQALKGERVLWGAIERNGEDIGLVQILEKAALGKTLHALMLDRGPLWFEGYGSAQDFAAFCAALRVAFPKRPGRVIRFIPEVTTDATIEQALKTNGFKRKSQEYQTFILDLTPPADSLRAALKKNWRGTLNKAEKGTLVTDWDEEGRHLDWLLKFYNFDKKTKGYDGPDVKFIAGLAQYFRQDKDMLIGRALLNGQVVGAVLIFCHGRGATYQIGWNTQAGRAHGAHHVLLWQAILKLKDRDCTVFDLGGVNDEDAKNIKAFKEGLGGQLVSLAGLYT